MFSHLCCVYKPTGACKINAWLDFDLTWLRIQKERTLNVRFYVCVFSPMLPSTSMWGVYSETSIHHYNIPLALSRSHSSLYDESFPTCTSCTASFPLGHSIHIFVCKLYHIKLNYRSLSWYSNIMDNGRKALVFVSMLKSSCASRALGWTRLQKERAAKKRLKPPRTRATDTTKINVNSEMTQCRKTKEAHLCVSVNAEALWDVQKFK